MLVNEIYAGGIRVREIRMVQHARTLERERDCWRIKAIELHREIIAGKQKTNHTMNADTITIDQLDRLATESARHDEEIRNIAIRAGLYLITPEEAADSINREIARHVKTLGELVKSER